MDIHRIRTPSSPRFFRRFCAPCLAFLAGGVALESATIPARPNLIFIMADDLGYHDLGAYGQTEIQTPHLDAMAASGLRFTDVYAGSPVCAPSRSALMTGQHTGKTTVRGNFPAVGGAPDMFGRRRLPLAAEDVTVAEVLKKAGYTTGATGKWGLGEPGSGGEPWHKGFDEWFGFLNQQHAHSYYPEFQWHNGKRVEIPGNQDGERKTYSHDLHTEFALDFVRNASRSEQPFFLYLAYQIPHDRYEIPSLAPYEDRDWPHDAKVHAAMITLLDKDVGRLLGLLEELDIEGKTLVFFTSDNGAAKRWEGIFNSSHPLRGRKRDLYEGGIRVPMIVRGPGVPAGAVSDAPWYFPDVLPTFAELAGVSEAVPPEVSGMSVVESLTGGKQPELHTRPMYWEFFERGFDQAIRVGPWKAVRNGDQPTQLFHLGKDPGEKSDVAAVNPEVTTALERKMIETRTPSRHWPAPVDAHASPN